ncbi:PREDICTED: threonine aspartase 1 isoform X2 [Dipodomys ordii]|uniref:Threonine aspartase 1 n=1 Tax=Dipodomys ordii TaxID=10020 RepID=A0A1S3ESI3_DIPOR|nr:PREDICTED: threonine aspartase 1 isoform X2 [Dipodomys ordii]
MGSNLNLLGEIECDASIMDGKSLNFGAVGALSGIKNPVSVANRLLCEGQKGKLSAGRIPPCFLVGEGAYRWAVDHGIPSCPPNIMTTRFSLAAFKRNKRKLELAEKVETDFIQLKKRRQSSEKENDAGTLDTVGAVVVDHEGNVAAAVSSGGLALKHPGRVGQAALYGCGCWAENTGAHNPYSTAVSTSGCGEHLVRTILARECSHALQAEDAHQALLETMQNKFISSPFLASEDGVLGGVIVLRSCRCSTEPDSPQNKQTLLVEFLWSHTTESMCVGYMSAQDGKAKVALMTVYRGSCVFSQEETAREEAVTAMEISPLGASQHPVALLKPQAGPGKPTGFGEAPIISMELTQLTSPQCSVCSEPSASAHPPETLLTLFCEAPALHHLAGKTCARPASTSVK